MNFSRFVQRRARGDRFLAAGILIAVFLAATVAAGGPIYLRSLERVGMADVADTLGLYNKNISVISDWIPLESTEIEHADSVVDSAVNDDLVPLIQRRSTRIKSRAHFWALNNTEIVRGEFVSRAYFHELEGLFDAVTYIEGKAPGPNLRTDDNGDMIIEVAVYETRSRQLRHGNVLEDLNIGDVISATSVSRRAGIVKAEIVGIFVENDPRDEFWLGSATAILEPQPPTVFGGREIPIVLFTAQDAIAPGVGPSNAGLPMSYMRVLFTDPEQISLIKAGVLVFAIDRFEEVIADGLPRATTLAGARASTRRMATKMLFLRLPALLLAVLGVAVVGYYLFLVSGLIARRREMETVMLRSRGLSTFQVLRVQVIEAVVTVVLPAAIAPLLAAMAIGLAGRLPVFESLTGGQNLPVELSPMAWAWAAGAALIAFLIVLAPTLSTARSGVSDVDRSRARPDRPPVFQRFYFDLIIVVLGGLFLWEITTRGVATTDREGEIVTDPTLLFAPVMMLISVALLMLRAFPLMTRAGSWMATRFTSASVAVGFWRLSRSPYWYAWPVLLIILGTGLGVMVGTLGSTLERSNLEQIFYDNGTNLRILPGGLRADIRPADIADLSAIDGVNLATMAFRQNARVGTTSRGLEFTVLGVDSERFADMAWFRDDFADETLATLLERVSIPAKPEPLILPRGTTAISAWTKQDPYVNDHFFWIVLKGAEGRRVTVTLGQIGADWAEQFGEIPEHLVDPIEIISLQTFMQAGGDGGAPTTWFIDDLKVSGPGFEQVLLDFENTGLWTPIPTSNGLDDSYADANEDPGVGDPGTGVGMVVLERGTVAGVRGIYRSATGEPLPVIVSENFVSLAAIAPGQPGVVQIFGGFIPIVPVATVSLFPTLDPDVRPFMVIDVQALLDFVELRGLVNISANEVFVDIDPENHAETTSAIRRIFRAGSLLDREARVEESVIDPLTVAGWRGMGFVALIIGGAALVLGYFTYLVAHSNRTIHDSAYLRAMGLSKPGFMRSALIEHGIVAVIGVIVGVASGLVASRVAVGAIAHSETGRALLPPFILQTSWWPVLAILALAAGAGMVGVVSSFVGFLRTPLHELTRTTE
ncbi:MAG: hypothetical protein IIC28_08420 [Chloroflexi bacterium]|nr:hypothetical protein [Chloroflexota bacterium]